eukprot:scaffold208271_cov23-Prasinocladus_malaysianus.AAC.1
MLETKGQGGCYATTTTPLYLGPRLSEGFQECCPGVMGSGLVCQSFSVWYVVSVGVSRRIYNVEITIVSTSVMWRLSGEGLPGSFRWRQRSICQCEPLPAFQSPIMDHD